MLSPIDPIQRLRSAPVAAPEDPTDHHGGLRFNPRRPSNRRVSHSSFTKRKAFRQTEGVSRRSILRMIEQLGSCRKDTRPALPCLHHPIGCQGSQTVSGQINGYICLSVMEPHSPHLHGPVLCQPRNGASLAVSAVNFFFDKMPLAFVAGKPVYNQHDFFKIIRHQKIGIKGHPLEGKLLVHRPRIRIICGIQFNICCLQPCLEHYSTGMRDLSHPVSIKQE